ncbi:MAG: exonuclease domain-containing protein, partial [Aquificaceae bacterium]|nr:exonuclease domain-containing protein [Aquificaceae bacterium]
MREILLESTFVSIDVEATGVDPSKSEIVEIACVRVEGGVITETFSTLVNPGYSVPPKITALTGITNAMLVGKPKMEDVLPKFL